MEAIKKEPNGNYKLKNTKPTDELNSKLEMIEDRSNELEDTSVVFT